jgi:hypothetical protein
MVTCCECQFEGASSWHFRMHEWVERQRCAFRFGCRNAACLALHTIAEQEHKWTKQELGQREWEAECGFCCVGTCRYGAMCQRTARSVVAYDSSYEDNEDGWSVVGVGGTELVGRTDGASLGAPGRFDPLVETSDDDDDHEDVPGDKFFDCPCDDPEFRFVIREERRVKQQQRRRQKGQQRKGRTARKRVQAAVQFRAAATSVSTRKRLCWLRAKLQRTVVLWQAVRLEAAACYGAQDGCEWRQLEREMEMSQADDERFWQDAVEKLRSGEVLYCFGEETQMERVLTQIERFRRIAADGKGSRFKAEKWATMCQATSGERTYDESMSVYNWRAMRRRNRRELLGRRPIDDSSSDYDC